MVYIKEQGYVDTPSTPVQFKLIKGVAKAVNMAQKLGYKVIIISNQPGIAKGYYKKKIFELITKKMHSELRKNNVTLDGEFYCFHHPDAKLISYKKICTCRKPRTGLIKKAVSTYKLDLKNSYFIGDGIVDMEASKRAGCKSIFVGNVNSTITGIFKKKKIEPVYVAHNLLDAINFVKDQSSV